MKDNTKILIATISFLACVFVPVGFGRVPWEVGSAFFVAGLPILLMELRKPNNSKEDNKPNDKP